MKIFLNNEQKMNDIIFANRNKSYGAYAIRASYNNTLLRSLIIVSSTILLFMGACYVLNHKQENVLPNIDTGGVITTTVILKPDEVKPPVDPPKPSSKTPKSSVIATIINDTVHETKPGVTEINPFGKPNGDTAMVDPNNLINGPGTGSFVPEVKVTEEVLTTMMPDEAPVFEGGPNALRNFLGRNTVYPQPAIELNKEGTVFVSFVVSEKGIVENVKVTKGIGAGCDEEAARVVSKIPKFIKPGTVGGKPVKVLYNVPIKFKLN
jgi:protein TonB